MHVLSRALLVGLILTAVNFVSLVESQAKERDVDPNRLRIVIAGFNNYQGGPGAESVVKFNDLKFAAADAKEMYDSFRGYGVPESQIKLFTDEEQGNSPSFSEVQEYVRNLKTTEDETLLFLFFGHGINVGKDSYLCFPQTRIEGNPNEGNLFVSQGLSLDVLINDLSEQSASRRVIITDACRNLSSSLRTMQFGDNITRFDLTTNLKQKAQKEGNASQMVVISSCLPSEISREDEELEHGVFTGYFAEGLSGRADFEPCGNRDGVLSLYEIFQYASEKTRNRLSGSSYGQHPFWEGAITDQVDLVTLQDEQRAELSKQYQDFQLVRKPLGYKEQLATVYFDQALTSIYSDPSRVIELCSSALEQQPDFKQAFLLRSTMRVVRGDFAHAFDDLKNVEGRSLELNVPKSKSMELRSLVGFKVLEKLQPGTRLRISNVSKLDENTKAIRGKYLMVSHVAKAGSDQWEEKEGWIDTVAFNDLTAEEKVELIDESAREIDAATMTNRESALAQQRVPLNQYTSAPGASAGEILSDAATLYSAGRNIADGNYVEGAMQILGTQLPAQSFNPNQLVPPPVRSFVPSAPSIPYLGSLW